MAGAHAKRVLRESSWIPRTAASLNSRCALRPTGNKFQMAEGSEIGPTLVLFTWLEPDHTWSGRLMRGNDRVGEPITGCATHAAVVKTAIDRGHLAFAVERIASQRVWHP